MQSASATVNRALRQYLSPVIREAGFQRVDARNAWAWHPDCILVLNVRAVGNYFARVTGWSPASVNVWLGTFYTFVSSPANIKISKNGLPLPAEFQCHMRSHLECSYPQHNYTRQLKNPAEQQRRDIWWLDADGANAERVSSDIAHQFEKVALNWFAHCMDLNMIITDIESERNCFNKYVLAAYVSARLGRMDLKERYTVLAEEEGRRIGRTPDPKSWFPLAGR